jgi:hypothetical protein
MPLIFFSGFGKFKFLKLPNRKKLASFLKPQCSKRSIDMVEIGQKMFDYSKKFAANFRSNFFSNSKVVLSIKDLE